MTSLTPDAIKTIEQTRQRLSYLTNSLAALERDIANSNPLPTWSSLHSRFSLLSQNLLALHAHLAAHAPTLNAMAAFPLPEMPGSEDKEALVGQLLRKKPEVGVEEWVAEARGLGAEVVAAGAKGEVEDMWAWAMVRANEEARRWEWMTAERTPGEMEGKGEGGGEGEMDEEEEGEEEEERGEEQVMGVEEMLRFMSTGAEGGRR